LTTARSTLVAAATFFRTARHDGTVQRGQEDPTTEATFAFIDLAGFTALTEAHGDAEAVNVIRAFRDRVQHNLRPGDLLVKTIGDAVMLTFPNPRRAVEALRALLGNELVHDDTVLLPRAGAHHGAAVAVDGDFYGADVNLAARVAGQARGGELLVTTETAMAARDAGAVITHVGAVELRNIPAPVDIYRVQVAAPATDIAVDPVCQMRVPVVGPTAISLDWEGQSVHFCGLPCVARFAAHPERYPAGRKP
jgi:class 3 adenylate cyclase/YHS domain-containing protein